MYFATDPVHASLPLLIAQEFLALRSAHADMPLHLFALVDGAFDEPLIAVRERKRLPLHSLYANTALQAMGAAAPHLFSAAADAEPAAWLLPLFDACAGKPMLSIIASTLSADALQRHMRPYLIARTPDSMEWPVRWGDTRVLPALIDALTAFQRSHLLRPMPGWWSVARDGSLRNWQGAAALEPSPAGFDQLPLSDAAFVLLVDAAEADAVLANLHDTQPDLLRQHSPARCHARVARHLALASVNGIDASGARQHFSALALNLADDFTMHPAMATLLQRTRQGADYLTEIGALPDDFWQATALPKVPITRSKV
jgi:hypothetical protein